MKAVFAKWHNSWKRAHYLNKTIFLTLWASLYHGLEQQIEYCRHRLQSSWNLKCFLFVPLPLLLLNDSADMIMLKPN
ncbi:unnamed protein product [Allacma fusca]|uniref:Uncharacterized protein n=1 Tax=Allacma fusca TaxID=39272 RepID=A0A8J2K092_9HEXA|nr:unnamed protein product [Allacma fusca]